ncbi:MAG: response regulator [Deltaproteobacteria bacterium]|nr:response regulator [Deltaproteobacteria bacterium]
MPHNSPILLVDDRPQDVLTVRGLLADRGYDIVTAASGAEALKQVLERQFALILLDVRLPDMNGFEVASIIKGRERSRDTPIVFLTAAGTDPRFIYRAYSVGAVDYLHKPIDRDLLRAKVAVFVELFRKDLRIARQAEELRVADRRERALELGELRLASERRYRNLAEAIPQIVWTAGPDGGADYFNRRWFEYTGLDGPASVGWGWLNAVDAEDRERHAEAWREALGHADVYQAECRLLGRDGRPRWHLCRVVRELDATGAVTSWLGTYTDCDDLKHAHEQSEAARRLAQLAIQARDDFLSIASHELRTPLTALQLNLQNLERVAPTAPRDKMAAALRQTQRLTRLVDNLLDLSRITSGHLQLELEQLDLALVTREVVERMRDEAARAGCAVELSLHASEGRWDRLRLEQVVTNLVSNAIRYGAGKPIRVAVDEGGDDGGAGGSARLVVQDHGIGIEAKDLPRVFQRFERLAPQRHQGGLGMGLYIVREIVAAHGGGVTVESHPGAGSTFTTVLPREAAQPPRDQRIRPPGARRATMDGC